MSIIGVAIALLLAVSAAYLTVSAMRGPGITQSVTVPRPAVSRPQSVRSESNFRDQEQLRKYFLQGLPDGRGRVLP
jgi:hypothetical protein